MKPTLSRFAIKVDKKALKPERNRHASTNMPNKIFVILYAVCWCKIKHVSGAKYLVIITKSLQIKRFIQVERKARDKLKHYFTI